MSDSSQLQDLDTVFYIAPGAPLQGRRGIVLAVDPVLVIGFDDPLLPQRHACSPGDVVRIPGEDWSRGATAFEAHSEAV